MAKDKKNTNVDIFTRRKKESRKWGLIIAVGVLVIVAALMSLVEVRSYETYRNNMLGFKINYPADWNIIEGTGGAVVAFVSPREGEYDTASENVNITVQNVAGTNMSLMDFTNTAIRQFTVTFEDTVNILTSEPALMGGESAHRFVYRGVVPDKETDPIQNMHVWTLRNQIGYIFTYTAAQSGYQTHLPEVNAMIESFTFLN